MFSKVSDLITSYKSWRALLEHCREFLPFEEVFALQSEYFGILAWMLQKQKAWLTLSLICLASSAVWLSVTATIAVLSVWFPRLKFSSELGTGMMRNRLSLLVCTRGDIITVLQTKHQPIRPIIITPTVSPVSATLGQQQQFVSVNLSKL